MDRLAARRVREEVVDRLPDAVLVDRVRAGEPALFELIMRRYNRRLFRIARGILGNAADAQDAVQEAYVNAYFKLGQFRGPDGFASWLCQIVTNQALMQRRRRRRDTLSPLSVLDESPREDDAGPSVPHSPHGNPEMGLHEYELRRLLEQAIDGLPEVYRAAFVFREIEQISVADTARCLGIEEATVKTRVHRARRLLQRNLTAELTSALSGVFGFAGARCDEIVTTVMRRIGQGGN